jgi:hypothetical protein
MVSVFKYIPDCVLGGEDKEEEFKIIEVRTDRIAVFDAKGELEHVCSGIKIRNCHFQDERYLYALQDASKGQVSNKEIKSKLDQGETETDEQFKTAGVFIYDMQQVVDKKALRIKLSEALVSTNDSLSYSSFNHRISFI